MALTERDMLRIYADPGISPEEKVRLLGEDEPDLALSPIDVAPPAGRLASLDNFAGAVPDETAPPAFPFPDEAPVVPSNAHQGPPRTAADNFAGRAPPSDTRPAAIPLPAEEPAARPASLAAALAGAIGPAPTEVTADPNMHRGRPAPVGFARDPDAGRAEAQAAREAELQRESANRATVAVSDEAGDGEPAYGRRTLSPAEIRAELDRTEIMSRQARGGAGVPTEAVSEEVMRERGTFRPGDRGAIIAAQTEADMLEEYAGELALENERAANRIQLASLDAQNEEQRRFETLRREEMGKARRTRERMNTISEEIAQMPPAEEGLFVGKNFGESLLVGLGALAFGLGAGAAGNSAQIMPTLQAMARREVDRQKRYVDTRMGQLDQLGTIYERHLANLQDDDLASKATVADIMRGAERQMLALAMDPATTEAKRTALQAAAAQIRAGRVSELAQLDAQYGDKVKEGVTRQFRRPLQLPPRAKPPATGAAAAQPPAPMANPKPKVADFASPDEYFRALADWQGREEALEQQAIAALKKPAARPRRQAAPAAESPGTVNVSMVDVRADPKEAKATAAIETAGELWAQGRSAAAFAALTPEQQKYWRALYEQSSQNLGVGGDKTAKAETSDAAQDAWNKLLGAIGPSQLVPRTERERIVSDGGQVYFATSKEAAALANDAIQSANKAIAKATELSNIATQFAGSGYKSPELRGRITVIGSELMAELSRLDEQGVIREGGDEARYAARAGSALADFVENPTIDLGAAISTTLRSLRSGKRSYLSTLSTSWRDFESAAPAVRKRGGR